MTTQYLRPTFEFHRSIHKTFNNIHTSLTTWCSTNPSNPSSLGTINNNCNCHFTSNFNYRTRKATSI